MSEVFIPAELTTINGLVSSAVTTINANFAALAALLADVYSLSGVAPNQLSSDLDMGSNTILNLPSPVNPTDPVRLGDLTGLKNPYVMVGAGVPTFTALKGTLFLRTDGSSTSTRAYINTNGSTGWTNLVTAS